MSIRARTASTADIDEGAQVGDGSTVWHLAQIREGATVGENCTVGRGAYIDAHVVVGDNVKIQNHALVYAPARLEDGVFIGPAAILTNDTYPRAVNPDGTLKSGADWEAKGVTIREGAAVGARAVVLAGVTMGRWSMAAAGAVITKDVPDYALVVGVPAHRIGWVGPSGVPLEPDGDARWRCPVDGTTYQEINEALEATQ